MYGRSSDSFIPPISVEWCGSIGPILLCRMRGLIGATCLPECVLYPADKNRERPKKTTKPCEQSPFPIWKLNTIESYRRAPFRDGRKEINMSKYWRCRCTSPSMVKLERRSVVAATWCNSDPCTLIDHGVHRNETCKKIDNIHAQRNLDMRGTTNRNHIFPLMHQNTNRKLTCCMAAQSQSAQQKPR